MPKDSIQHNHSPTLTLDTRTWIWIYKSSGDWNFSLFCCFDKHKTNSILTLQYCQTFFCIPGQGSINPGIYRRVDNHYQNTQCQIICCLRFDVGISICYWLFDLEESYGMIMIPYETIKIIKTVIDHSLLGCTSPRAPVLDPPLYILC